MQISKYLLANERDSLWGLTVSTVGYEDIKPGESYPTRGHADGYYFELERGRELNEYQLLYLTEGEGIFHSATVREAPLREGDLCLLSSGLALSQRLDRVEDLVFTLIFISNFIEILDKITYIFIFIFRVTNIYFF